MSHLDEKLLQKSINDAKKKIKIGGIYRHYKSGDLYRVLDLGIIEGTDRVCVIYEAQYGRKIVWVRDADSFNEKVSYLGKDVSRFQLV